MREHSELKFIENLTKIVSELLVSDHVMVSEVFESDPSRAKALAFYSSGSLQPTLSYDLSGSPCETILELDSCVYNRDVCQLFPHDEMLQKLGAESYVGVPMMSVDGQKLGILAVLNNHSTEYGAAELEMLQVAAAQAAAELTQIRITNHLKESKRRLRTLMNSLPGMAYRCKNDAAWTMEIVSRGARELTGYTPQQLENNTTIAYQDLIHPEDRMGIDREVTGATHSDSDYSLNYRIERADGETRWVWEQGKGIQNTAGVITHFEGFVLDVTEHYLQQELMAEIAYTDELTGLPNRAALLNELQCRYQQKLVTGDLTPCLLLLIDLNRFRSINQRFGLHVGDRLLRFVTHQLKRAANEQHEQAYLARLTGDEFVIVSAGSGATEDTVTRFLKAADAISELFAEPVSVGEHHLQLQFRVAGAYSTSADSAAELLQQASIALYEAKQNGLRYCIYDDQLAQKVRDESKLSERFRVALANQELTVHLQPQIDLQTGNCVGAEVLCRWFDEELGSVPPDVFIAIATKQGVLTELGYQVLEKTCALIRKWREHYAFVPVVSVNIGAQQFASLEVVDEFVKISEHLPAQAITFEITESDLMLDPQQALAVTERLRNYGFQLAIDDFGTGYSSLAYLQQFNVDILKIDMSFVQAMTLDEQSKNLVATIIAMARTLNLSTIAEGIETAEQAKLLKDLGCQQGQGYYFARPLSAAEFEQQWLHD